MVAVTPPTSGWITITAAAAVASSSDTFVRSTSCLALTCFTKAERRLILAERGSPELVRMKPDCKPNKRT